MAIPEGVKIIFECDVTGASTQRTRALEHSRDTARAPFYGGFTLPAGGRGARLPGQLLARCRVASSVSYSRELRPRLSFIANTLFISSALQCALMVLLRKTAKVVSQLSYRNRLNSNSRVL